MSDKIERGNHVVLQTTDVKMPLTSNQRKMLMKAKTSEIVMYEKRAKFVESLLSDSFSIPDESINTDPKDIHFYEQLNKQINMEIKSLKSKDNKLYKTNIAMGNIQKLAKQLSRELDSTTEDSEIDLIVDSANLGRLIS